MAKIYLGGGSSIQKGESEHIDKQAFFDVGGSPKVLVFPWTGKDADAYRDVISAYFTGLGASNIVYAELEDSHQDISDKLDKSDIIYLPGGDTLMFLERLQPYADLLKAYDKVIIGNSAGSLVLAKEFAIFRDEPKLLPALGIVDFALSVHYNTLNTKYSIRDEKIHKLLSQRTGLRLYAIEENSALVYDTSDGSTSFIGKVDIFHNGKLVEK